MAFFLTAWWGRLVQGIRYRSNKIKYYTSKNDDSSLEELLFKIDENSKWGAHEMLPIIQWRVFSILRINPIVTQIVLSHMPTFKLCQIHVLCLHGTSTPSAATNQRECHCF